MNLWRKKRKHFTRRAAWLGLKNYKNVKKNEDLMKFFFCRCIFYTFRLASVEPSSSPPPNLHFPAERQHCRPLSAAWITCARRRGVSRDHETFCPTLICIRCPHQAVEQLVSVERHRRLQCFQKDPKTQTFKMIVQWRLTRNPVQTQNVLNNINVLDLWFIFF